MLTLASTLLKASCAVISFFPPRFLRYLCSKSQVRQRTCSTSSPIMATMEWSWVRLQREQWSSMTSPNLIAPISLHRKDGCRKREESFATLLLRGSVITFAGAHAQLLVV